MKHNTKTQEIKIRILKQLVNRKSLKHSKTFYKTLLKSELI